LAKQLELIKKES
jgi:hypothetical protein